MLLCVHTTTLTRRWGTQQPLAPLSTSFAGFSHFPLVPVSLLRRYFAQSLPQEQQQRPSKRSVFAAAQPSAAADRCTLAPSSPAPIPTTPRTELQHLQFWAPRCSVHPLEQLLRKGGPHEPWMPLLQETCRGLPIPKQRVWGDSYREIQLKALPRPLRLELTERIEGETAAALAAEVEGKAGIGAAAASPPVLAEPGSGVHTPSIPREVLLGLSRAAKITHLLPLQQLALPLLLQPHTDVLLAGPAGSGKSVAAALSLICHLAQELEGPSAASEGTRTTSGGPPGAPESPLEPQDGTSFGASGGPQDASVGCIRALFITPTRDMAVQTRNLLQALGRYTGLRVEMLVGRGPGEAGGGGAPWERFGALLHARPQVVVCTPGKAEEFVCFLLAAKHKGLTMPGHTPQAVTPGVLSNCKLLAVEDVALQLHEPSMLRTLAKVKELLPMGELYVRLKRRALCSFLWQ